MGHFRKEFFEFFEELRENNNKDWFDANRQRYIDAVRNPFLDFVTELILRVQDFDPEITIAPKDAIFRINRDVRFTKDKTPYKLHMAASLTRIKRKEEDFAGYYIHVSPFYVHVGGGLYFINKRGLQSVRQYISENIDQFLGIIQNPQFKNTYKEILGDKNKRVPAEFTSIAKKTPLIMNKQFYYTAELNPSSILADNFAETVASHYHIALEFNQFMREALVYKSK